MLCVGKDGFRHLYTFATVEHVGCIEYVSNIIRDRLPRPPQYQRKRSITLSQALLLVCVIFLTCAPLNIFPLFHSPVFKLQEEPSEEEEQDDATWAKNVTAGKLSKGEKLMAVDHSTIDYPSFRRNFYIEVPDIKRMEEAEVAALRKELDGIKVGW